LKNDPIWYNAKATNNLEGENRGKPRCKKGPRGAKWKNTNPTNYIFAAKKPAAAKKKQLAKKPGDVKGKATAGAFIQ